MLKRFLTLTLVVFLPACPTGGPSSGAQVLSRWSVEAVAVESTVPQIIGQRVHYTFTLWDDGTFGLKYPNGRENFGSWEVATSGTVIADLQTPAAATFHFEFDLSGNDLGGEFMLTDTLLNRTTYSLDGTRLAKATIVDSVVMNDTSQASEESSVEALRIARGED